MEGGMFFIEYIYDETGKLVKVSGIEDWEEVPPDEDINVLGGQIDGHK